MSVETGSIGKAIATKTSAQNPRSERDHDGADRVGQADLVLVAGGDRLGAGPIHVCRVIA